MSNSALVAALGVQLFERHSRRMEPTAAGLRLMQRAEELLDMARRIAEETKNQGNIAGEIMVGDGESPACPVVSRCAHDFRQIHPGVSIGSFVGNLEQILLGLKERRLDCAVVPAHCLVRESLEGIELPGKSRWGVLVATDDPLCGKRSASAAALRAKPLFVPEGVPKGHTSFDPGLLEGASIAGTFNLAYHVDRIVAEGHTRALCIEKAEYSATRGVQFVPLAGAKAIPFALARSKTSPPTSQADAFWDFIKTAAAAVESKKRR